MHRKLFLLMIVSFLTASQLYGQHVIAQMKPDPVGTNLRLHFDINLDPNDDVSPNIIFTPDGRRAFVSYPTVLDTKGTTDTRSHVITSMPGKIVVFNPTAPGEMLDDGTRRIRPDKIIDTGTIEIRPRENRPGRPAQMSITPDGKIIAVVNVFSDAIFIIDAENAELRTTFRFPGAQFGFGNNIVFSPDVQPDGYIGYISSFRQDSSLTPIEGEVLRFKVGTNFAVQEMSPRVRVGIGPANLAISQDGQVLTVVNTLSKTERGQVTVPAKISILDVAAFRVKAEVRPGSGETFNFLFTNNVALTPDGKTGIVATIVATQQASTSKAIVFNTDNGEGRARADVGVNPNSITLTPDNRFFAVVTAGSIFFVEIESILSPDEATRRAAVRELRGIGIFSSSSNPVFPFDKSRAFITTSLIPGADRLISFDLGTGAIDSSTVVGNDREDNEPMHAAVSPNGSVVAVVNFRTDAIDLVADALNLDFPFLHSEQAVFTQIGYLNPTSVEAKDLRFTLLTNGGVSLVTSPPVTAPSLAIAPRSQKAQMVDQIFELNRDQTNMGWATLSVDNFDVIGFFTLGNLGANVNAMAGGLPISRRASRRHTELIFPEMVRQREVVRGEDGQVVRDTERLLTQIHLVNPNFNTANVTLELLSRQMMDDMVQVVVATSNITIPGQVRITRFLQEIFPDQTQAEEFTGYLRVTSDIGLIGYELVIRDNRITVMEGEEPRVIGGFSAAGLNAVPRVGLSPGARTLYSPLIFSERDGSETFLNLINLPREIRRQDGSVVEVAGAEVNVRLSLFAPQGNLMASLTEPIKLKPGEQMRKGIRSLFNQIQGDSVIGWLQVEIESTDPGNSDFNVLGDVTLAGPGNSFLEAAPLQERGLTDIIFPQVVNGKPFDNRPDDQQPFINENFRTSLAISNPNSERATVTIEVFTEAGEPSAMSSEIQIEPRGQVTRFLDEIFPMLMPQFGGHIRIRSNPGVLSLMALMAENLNGRDFFVVLPPQGVTR